MSAADRSRGTIIKPCRPLYFFFAAAYYAKHKILFDPFSRRCIHLLTHIPMQGDILISSFNASFNKWIFSLHKMSLDEFLFRVSFLFGLPERWRVVLGDGKGVHVHPHMLPFAQERKTRFFIILTASGRKFCFSAWTSPSVSNFSFYTRRGETIWWIKSNFNNTTTVEMDRKLSCSGLAFIFKKSWIGNCDVYSQGNFSETHCVVINFKGWRTTLEYGTANNGIACVKWINFNIQPEDSLQKLSQIMNWKRRCENIKTTQVLQQPPSELLENMSTQKHHV